MQENDNLLLRKVPLIREIRMKLTPHDIETIVNRIQMLRVGDSLVYLERHYSSTSHEHNVGKLLQKVRELSDAGVVFLYRVQNGRAWEYHAVRISSGTSERIGRISKAIPVPYNPYAS